MNRVLLLRSTVLSLLGIALLCSCTVQPVSIDPGKLSLREGTLDSRTGEYRLQLGDRISLVCVLDEQLGASNTYFINVGDVIGVIIQDRADLSLNYIVNPDGTIQFMQLSTIQVAGLSLEELRQHISERYKRIGVSSFLSVGFFSYNTAAESFISKLNPGGIGREPFSTTINIDGNANFPLIGFVELSGVTLKEANEIVQSAYRKHFGSIDVTLRIEESTGHNVTVIGEVKRPGSFVINGSISVLAAVGAAGGYLPEAKRNSVITVRRRDNEVFVHKYDADKDLFIMATRKLAAGDFVFVPRSPISNLNLFVDQYLRRSLPFGTAVTATYTVD